MTEPKPAKSFYNELTKEEQQIVARLKELEVHGNWESLFFRDAIEASKLLKPNIVNYLMAMNVLGTMKRMSELLDINLEIAKGKNTAKKMKIQATLAATEIGKAYAALMNNIIKNAQRESDDEKAKPPAMPSFYAAPAQPEPPATNGDSRQPAETSP